MQKTKIKVIEKYLVSLPDSALDQVVAFVSYLNYMKDIDSGYPYPDEYATIKQYNKKRDKLLAWDAVKGKL